MAIDTAQKRRSVQASWPTCMLPVADGTISAPDRAQAAWFYAGQTYGAPAVSDPKTRINKFFSFLRRR